MAKTVLEQFRTNIGDWLISIGGLTDKIGTGGDANCYAGWPKQFKDLPLVSYGYSKEALGDYPTHAWNFTLEIDLVANTAQELDAMELAIHDHVGGSDGDGGIQTFETELTDDNLEVHEGGYDSTTRDNPAFDPFADGGLVGITRTMTFTGVLREK